MSIDFVAILSTQVLYSLVVRKLNPGEKKISNTNFLLDNVSIANFMALCYAQQNVIFNTLKKVKYANGSSKFCSRCLFLSV
ncbi:hypothetical protein CLOAM1729 [Candidatus Cloacimonas acidaminovorans str. Evry]|uniref:Uncharacterized protein n=1 Tax=Cloacimonas acidaminovorans (strain Evry) TaxID=459349 RepID=B0VJB1_CLOAI|nr:hypothetical protein CLOAM1729 [Candidatus Cloacimonas acidaminovorans str. Evry]